MKKIGKIGSEKIIEVKTAREITDENILKRIEKRLGQETEVRLIVDESLRGGIYIKDLYQNKQFDGTVKKQLNLLREEIIK